MTPHRAEFGPKCLPFACGRLAAPADRHTIFLAKKHGLLQEDREEKVALVDEKIEKNIEMIGSTAIEDRLQNKVADTI